MAKTPIPDNCQQMLLVITDSTTATKGYMYQLQRDNADKKWQKKDKIIISLGRNGLGAGIGLHDVKNLSPLSPKREGDGKSPAGIFDLSAVFGYKSPQKMSHLQMPYIHITTLIECIDDAASDFYNNILSKEGKNIDWNSSEKMSRAGIYYEQGIVVEHNTKPIKKGAGSCIFIHNWAKPYETTAGCTVMEPADLTKIINWLDSEKRPVLVQLTQQLYDEFMKKWKLPQIE
jgi:D-alanyl-D-alanine dipeptidase